MSSCAQFIMPVSLEEAFDMEYKKDAELMIRSSPVE
jgi:hypothetical protein